MEFIREDATETYNEIRENDNASLDIGTGHAVVTSGENCWTWDLINVKREKSNMFKSGDMYMIAGSKCVFLGVSITPAVRLIFKTPEGKTLEATADWIDLHRDEIEAV